MSNQIFTYTLVRYINSQVTGEVINVGILFIFPEHRKAIFKYPSNFSRLKGLYKDFSEGLLKNYLGSFDKKAKSISKQWGIYSDNILNNNPSEFIAKEFLLKDSTAIQFDATRTGVVYVDDLEVISEHYFQLFFSDYEVEVSPPVKRDTKYIINKYKSLLSRQDSEFQKYIHNEPFEVKSEKASLNFDIYWQNGTKNLVKPLSFDLASAENINSKALLYNARLNYLSSIAKNENYRFDFLITKPQDYTLLQDYYNALEILKDNDAPKCIVEENRFEWYSEKTIDEVTKK